MRILPIRDLSTRAVTSYDIFLEVLFNGKPPEAFDPSKNYSPGDLVYTTDENGDIHIWQVINGGTYPNVSEPNFSEYNLMDVIERQMEELEKLTGIRSKISSKIYDVTSMTYNLASGETTIDDIVLSDYNEADGDYCEVYVNGKFIPMSLWELTVAESAADCVDRNGTLVIDSSVVTEATNSVILRVNYATSLITRMIERMEVVVTAEAKNVTVSMTKNILPPPASIAVGTSGLTSITKNDDGSFSVTGTTGDTTSDIYIYGASQSSSNINIPNLPHGWLSFSCGIPSVEAYFRYIDLDGEYHDDKDHLAFSSGMKLVGLFLRFPASTTFSEQALTLQLEESIEPTEYVPYEANSTTQYDPVPVPYPLDPRVVALQYDLYVNGIFTPSGDLELEYDDEGHCQITKFPAQGTGDQQMVFEFVYSITNEVVLLKQDYTKVLEDNQEKFLVDLTPIDFVDSFQEIKVFNGDNVVDPGRYVPSKGRLNVVEESYYFNVGDTLKFSVWSYLLPDYIAGMVRHNSQTVGAIIDDTLRVGIPFLEWDVQTDDLMVFNDAGCYLSNCKWYLDGDYMQYFKHDEGVDNGDFIDFRLIDTEDSTQMQNIYIPVTTDGQKTFTVNQNLDMFSFMMLFTTSGEYIPSGKYTIQNNTIILTSGVVTLVAGDRLEIVGFRYVGDHASTGFQLETIYSTKDNQTIFTNPYSDYDPSTDSLLIFNNAGQYVGERFYTVSATTITLLGSGVNLGEYLEIIRVRNSNVELSVEIDMEVIDKDDLDLNDIYGDEVATRLMSLDLVRYGVLTENDANFLRTQVLQLDVTAVCEGVSYPAALLFSGTRCILAIDTVDATMDEYGVVAGNVVAVVITARTATIARQYTFDIIVNPRDLNTIELGGISTGESLIVPSLQKLMRTFPIANLTGLDPEFIDIIKNAADVRVIAAFDDGTPIGAEMTTTLDGEPAIDFGDITEGCTIVAQILVNQENAEDYLIKFTLEVTNPWQLEYTQLIVNDVTLLGLEDPYVRLDALYGETKQDKTSGNNAVDVTRFEEENNVTIDAVIAETGSITVTGTGATADQFVDIPLLGIVDPLEKYVLAVDSQSRTNDAAGDVICGLEIIYGELDNEYAYVNIPLDQKYIDFNMENFINPKGVNLRIYTNSSDTAGIGTNTVTITGLRVSRYDTAEPYEVPFETFSGMEAAPNPDHTREIIGAGVKTYNLLDLSGFSAVSKNGLLIQYSKGDLDLTISGTCAAQTVVDLPEMKDALTNGRTYTLSHSHPTGVDMTARLIVTTSSGSSEAGSVVFDSTSMTSVKVRLTINSGTFDEENDDIRLHLMVADTTDGEVTKFVPHGYEIPIYIQTGNIFDFTKIGEVNNNGLLYTPTDEKGYKITGNIADLEAGSVASITLSHEESLALFTAGTYTVVSGDSERDVQPYVFVNVFYNGQDHEMATSEIYKTFAITDVMRQYADFAATLGFKSDVGVTMDDNLDTRYIFPQLLRSENTGSEWTPNENNVLVIDFSMPDDKVYHIYLPDVLYGRPTKLVNHLSGDWIPSRTTNGVTITNNENGSITFSGSRQDETTIIVSQKSFTHVESLTLFTPGEYMVTSGDSVGNMNPYVFIDVMTGDDQTVVASATSKTASSVVITEEMWEDPDFVVAVGVRMDTGTGAFNARTIWPMMLIKPEVESPILVNEWVANSAGVYMYNFVPYFAPYENPVDLTKDRYGYSGDCVVMEDSYKVHRRMARVVFTGSENWTKLSTYQAFSLSGTGVIPASGQGNLVPDIYSDQFTAVAISEASSEHNYITISNNGEIIIHDVDYRDLTASDWKSRLAATPVTVVFPVLEEESFELCSYSKDELATMVGFSPKMRIYQLDEANPLMELVYKLRVDVE